MLNTPLWNPALGSRNSSPLIIIEPDRLEGEGELLLLFRNPIRSDTRRLTANTDEELSGLGGALVTDGPGEAGVRGMPGGALVTEGLLLRRLL